MRILVTGAEGFIGRYVAAALRGAGHRVIAGVRRPASSESVACDFNRDLDPAVWLPRLEGIDAVVNAVGILRESKDNTFECVHVLGPKALFEACVQTRARRVIQISALGSPEVAEYLASKHRGDAELSKLDLEWAVLRPSLVYSISGSYGGTSLLRAMAALPGVIVVPGSGEQQVQPVRAEDLALVVLGLITKDRPTRQVISVVGPERVSLLGYLQAFRSWLELPGATVIRTPRPIALGVAWIGEYFSDGPLGVTMWRMLQSGNVGPPGAADDLQRLSGVTPLTLSQALAVAPSFVQDRWHARLYFLGPALRISLAILWMASATVGFVTPIATSQHLLGSAGVPTALVGPLVWTASGVDLVLGIAAALAWRIELVAVLMGVSLVVYTLFIGLAFPSSWLEPFGGLLKNLPLIPAVLVMGVLSRRR